MHRIMKRALFILPMLFGGFFANSQNFELRLNNAGNGVIAVEMREISGKPPRAADINTDLVFGICWDKNYNIDLGAVTSNYTIRKAGPETVSGEIEYQQFAKDPNPVHFPRDWNDGQWVTILTIPNNMAGNQALGTFSVCPTNLQELNINYNLVDYSVRAAGNATDVRIGSTVPKGIKKVNTNGNSESTDAPSLPEYRNDWTITPNPSKDFFILTLEAAKEEDVQMSVLDVTGRVIYQEILGVQAGENRHTVRLNAISAGIYQVNINWSDGEAQTKNLVIVD